MFRFESVLCAHPLRALRERAKGWLRQRQKGPFLRALPRSWSWVDHCDELLLPHDLSCTRISH